MHSYLVCLNADRLFQIFHQLQWVMYAISEGSGETTGSLSQITTISKSQSKNHSPSWEINWIKYIKKLSVFNEFTEIFCETETVIFA